VWLTRREDRRHRLLWYFLLAAFAALMLKPPPIGRYRFAPAAVLTIYAAAAVTWFGREIRMRRWNAVAWAAVAVAATLVVSATLLRSSEKRMRYRATEFLLAGEVYYRRNQPERALEELRAGLRSVYRGPEEPVLRSDYLRVAVELASVAHQLRRDDDAAAELRRLAADFPADGNLAQLVAVVDRERASPR
jgi:hypothetical protein